jgi:hypothetical protein
MVDCKFEINRSWSSSRQTMSVNHQRLGEIPILKIKVMEQRNSFPPLNRHDEVTICYVRTDILSLLW